MGIYRYILYRCSRDYAVGGGRDDRVGGYGIFEYVFFLGSKGVCECMEELSECVDYRTDDVWPC